MPDNFKTDVADAGSAHQLVVGWRDCCSEDKRRAWLRMHLAVVREGGPELLHAVREAERVRFDDYLEPELRAAEAAGDRERMAELLADRGRFLTERREEAHARLHAELVKMAVQTATTPRARP